MRLEKINKFAKIVKSCVEDILILSGLAMIAGTTFFISKIAGFYVTGTFLFGLGVYFSKYPLRR